MIEAQQNMRNDALRRFQGGQNIIAPLLQRLPENAALSQDIEWFDKQIKSLGLLRNS
jgi:hypothetical protein